MTTNKKKTNLERIGFPAKTKRLTPEILKERVATLEKKLAEGAFKDKEEVHIAKYYLNHYRHKLSGKTAPKKKANVSKVKAPIRKEKDLTDLMARAMFDKKILDALYTINEAMNQRKRA